MRVYSNTHSSRGVEVCYRPWARDKGFWVFRIDAALNCMAFKGDVFLSECERQAAGDEGITAFGGGFAGIGNGFAACGSGVAVFWIAFCVASPTISAVP